MKFLSTLAMTLLISNAFGLCFITIDEVKNKLNASEVVELSKIEVNESLGAECDQILKGKASRLYLATIDGEDFVYATPETIDGLVLCKKL